MTICFTVFFPNRANSRLSEANSKLLNDRGRSLIASSLGGSTLDVGSLALQGHYGATLGPLNRSLGLGMSLLSPDGQNSRVEDYLAKVCTDVKLQSVMEVIKNRLFVDDLFSLCSSSFSWLSV